MSISVRMNELELMPSNLSSGTSNSIVLFIFCSGTDLAWTGFGVHSFFFDCLNSVLRTIMYYIDVREYYIIVKIVDPVRYSIDQN